MTGNIELGQSSCHLTGTGIYGYCSVDEVWAITELMLGEEEQETIVIFDAMKEFGLRELEL